MGLADCVCGRLRDPVTPRIIHSMSSAAWGTPPWTVSLEIAPTALCSSYEVAVIGGGLTGLSAAYHLARRGVGPVVLLEARRIGAGASGRTGGIVLEGTAVGIYAGVDRCLPYLQQLVEENHIACDLQLPGCWELRHEAIANEAQDASLPPAPPRAKAAAKPSQGLCWRDDHSFLRPFQKVAGGTVDPGALLAGLARAALAAGAELHEGAEVSCLEPKSPARLAVGSRTVRAQQVVVALNAYTAKLLSLPVALHSALTLAVCTEPLPEETLREMGLDPALPFYTVDLPYLWGRTLERRQVIFGAGLIAGNPETLARIHIGRGRAAALMAQLEGRIRQLHPRLAGVRFSHRWAGPIGFTPQRTPILSRLPEAPNILVAAGCAGHGIALGVRLGALIAAAVALDEPLPHWGLLQPA